MRAHGPLPWDERYAPFIARAGFLSLARLVQVGLPSMDAPLLTAMVDRWRPETHTFHLPVGELTVTLQDVAYILGLPIDGAAICGIIDGQGWRDRVEALLGVRPADPNPEIKDTKTAGVKSQWIREQFQACPNGAPEVVVERHARAWLWHLVAGFLFPDGTGDLISWMWLPILGQQWEVIRTYSWASATLAWLYRQLCEGCKRTTHGACLGGCAWLLQVWIWERFSVGRPDRSLPVVSA
jgi:Plant mobile domain